MPAEFFIFMFLVGLFCHLFEGVITNGMGFQNRWWNERYERLFKNKNKK